MGRHADLDIPKTNTNVTLTGTVVALRGRLVVMWGHLWLNGVGAPAIRSQHSMPLQKRGTQ